jgi:peptide chain release factor
MENEVIIQITSGRGPAECCWVVSQVVKKMLNDASRASIDSFIIQRNIGTEPSTLDSILLKFKGKNLEKFINSWIGTILWVGQSPYRTFHKRNNWYIGVNRIAPEEMLHWNDDDIRFQTLRSSGPGGQHVNKTESAVRAIHNPSGLSVTASDSRSQLQNKKLAIERLKTKITQWQMNELSKTEQNKWQHHNTLERGNPVKVFKGRDFVAVALQTFCLLFLLI